jgi:hypothetical protein
MKQDIDSHEGRMDFVSDTMARPPPEVNVVSLFQRDVPPQRYQHIMRRNDYGEPERELMLAVLEDAIYCFQSYASAQDSIRTRLFLQAKEWLMEDDDDDWLFSFANICEVFGFSLQYIRAGLLRHKDMEPAQVSTARVYQFAACRGKKKRFITRRGFGAQGSLPRPSTLVRVIS